jgi:uncharacterized protein
MKLKGRPIKKRIIHSEPKINQFSPRGKPGRPDEITINIDEFEAIRLADFSGLSQKDSAKSMKVSQQTFSRIIRKARKLLADALIQGKIIRVQRLNNSTDSRQKLTQENRPNKQE